MDSQEENSPVALASKHKQEKKALQATIQALKKSAVKGDKKKKKEVQEEITKLEKELEERHEQEVKALQEATEKLELTTDKELPNGIETSANTAETLDISESQSRTTKAQKRREKKSEKNKQRELEIEEEKKSNVDGKRSQELLLVNKALQERGLVIHEIPSNGNCMYLAVDHQLQQQNLPSRGNAELRRETASYMREKSDEFLPFLTSSKDDDMMNAEEFEAYCQEIERTAAWGGQLELRALSHVLTRPIEIIQGGAPTLIIGEEYSEEKPLIVTYHRHMYGLGEHYNSVVAKIAVNSEG